MIDEHKKYAIRDDVTGRYMTGLMRGHGITASGRYVTIPSFGTTDIADATRVDGDVVNPMLATFPTMILATPIEL